MNFGVNGSEIDGWDPALVGLEREPHDATDDVRVHEDQEGIVQHLHHGLVFNGNRHIPNLLEDLLQTQRLQQ